MFSASSSTMVSSCSKVTLTKLVEMYSKARLHERNKIGTARTKRFRKRANGALKDPFRNGTDKTGTGQALLTGKIVPSRSIYFSLK